MTLDLLFKGATLVDGTGAARRTADVGVRDGKIAEIGKLAGRATREVDADGLVLSPGFIDGHTHMDAQVAWDSLGSCSCWHGVTSVFMGNCGFALAPCKPDQREWFARCLEAVEDIPTESMLAGIDWTWETFPEYLDNVAALPKSLNYGAYLGHSALRMYTMGERALTETATAEDLRQMGDAVEQAMRAGATGFSTSRANTHITPQGTPVASRIADWSEIEHLVGRMGTLGAGVFQAGPDVSSGNAHKAFLERMDGLAEQSGRPIMFGVLSTRQGENPLPWTYQTDFIERVNARGGRMYGQGTTRSINAIFSFHSYLPFDVLPAWKAIRSLPADEQMRQLRDPAVRAGLVADEARMKPRDNVFQGGGAATTDPRKPDYANLYVMRDVMWDDPTVADLAAERGVHPVEVMIDLGLETNFAQIFVQPLVNESPDDIHGMLQSPHTLATFSDSGAHVCQEMGSSLQTHMLAYWVRTREAFSLETAVRMLTSDNARAWDITDRGLVKEGMAADLLLFDADRIKPCVPTVESDLPAGARRLVQKAEGIHMTMVNGQVTLEHGESTGAKPGEVLRGPLWEGHG